MSNILNGKRHRNLPWNGSQWVSMTDEGEDVGFTDNYLVAKAWCREKPGKRFWSFCPKIYLEGRSLEYHP